MCIYCIFLIYEYLCIFIYIYIRTYILNKYIFFMYTQTVRSLSLPASSHHLLTFSLPSPSLSFQKSTTSFGTRNVPSSRGVINRRIRLISFEVTALATTANQLEHLSAHPCNTLTITAKKHCQGCWNCQHSCPDHPYREYWKKVKNL